MSRNILIAILAILGLGAFASKSYIAGGILALIVFGLWMSPKRNKNQHSVSTNINAEYGEILRSRNALNEYYKFMESMQQAEKARDFSKMFLYVEKSLPILHKFVGDTKKEFGSFDIGSIPVIDIACRYWAALGEREKLQRLQAVLEEKAELKQWLPSVKAAFDDADLAEEIQKHLVMKPGSLQNQLGKVLGVSGRDTARIVATLVKLGKIRRESENKTYKLYIVES